MSVFLKFLKDLVSSENLNHSRKAMAEVVDLAIYEHSAYETEMASLRAYADDMEEKVTEQRQKLNMPEVASVLDFGRKMADYAQDHDGLSMDDVCVLLYRAGCKISAINIVRHNFDMGISEAKQYVENLVETSP